MVATPQIIKMKVSSMMKRMILGSILSALITIIFLSYLNGANEILDCGVFFCIYKESNDDGYESYSFTPFKTISLTMYLFTALFFVVVITPPFVALMRACITGTAGEVGSSSSSSTEAAPLLAKAVGATFAGSERLQNWVRVKILTIERVPFLENRGFLKERR
jgi:hypothetical protein